MREKTVPKNIFVQVTGGISSASHSTLAATLSQMAREHEGIYAEYAKIILNINIRKVLFEKRRNWSKQQILKYSIKIS